MKELVFSSCLACLLAGCGLFGGQQRRAAPARQERASARQPAHAEIRSDWDKRIGSVKMESDADRIGSASIETLAMGGPASAPKIADFLADPSPKVREKAVETLVSFGKQAEPGLARVHQLSRDIKPTTRAAATQVMALIGHPASRRWLERAAGDRHPLVRSWGLAGLARQGDDCRDRLEELAGLLAPAGRQAGQVAEAVAAAGCRGGDAVEKLAETLADDDEWVRAAAARALGSQGAQARPAVPALAGRLEDGSLRVRLATLAALAAIGPAAAAAVPALVKLLADPAPRIRRLAATALGSMGAAAGAAREPLHKLLGDPVDEVQAAARRALEQIGPSASPAGPAATTPAD